MSGHHQPPLANALKDTAQLICIWDGCNTILEDCPALYLHLVNHLPTNEQMEENIKFCCKWIECSFVCSKYHQLKSHIHIHVPNYKPFECHVCKRSFKRKYDLKKHVIGLHIRNIDSNLVNKQIK
eukprot:NODE_550_length_6834_cov_0.214402.p5 type:complete len:125 gc:universal NODE_550_length_6834_cov_0.214402:2495-2121(-)